MTTRTDGNPEEQRYEDEPPRWQQIIHDDILLILTLGLVIPTIIYLILGLMDLASVPMFKP